MSLASSEMVSNPWIKYWDRDRFWASSKIWEKNAEIFLRRTESVLPLGPGDSVLNIGCGPGFLELLLAPRVASICAADTSENLLTACSARCERYPHIRTALLGPNFTDLSGLGKFSVFLCVSVVQYYDSLEQIEALIASARDAALPGARMLIADFPLKRGIAGRLRDIFDSLIIAAREKYFMLFFQTAWRLLTGGDGYRDSSRRFKTLLFTRLQLKEIIRKMGLNAEILDKSVSVYANRPSLLIRFN